MARMTRARRRSRRRSGNALRQPLHAGLGRSGAQPTGAPPGAPGRPGAQPPWGGGAPQPPGGCGCGTGLLGRDRLLCGAPPGLLLGAAGAPQAAGAARLRGTVRRVPQAAGAAGLRLAGGRARAPAPRAPRAGGRAGRRVRPGRGAARAAGAAGGAGGGPAWLTRAPRAQPAGSAGVAASAGHGGRGRLELRRPAAPCGASGCGSGLGWPSPARRPGPASRWTSIVPLAVAAGCGALSGVRGPSLNRPFAERHVDAPGRRRDVRAAGRSSPLTARHEIWSTIRARGWVAQRQSRRLITARSAVRILPPATTLPASARRPVRRTGTGGSRRSGAKAAQFLQPDTTAARGHPRDGPGRTPGSVGIRRIAATAVAETPTVYSPNRRSHAGPSDSEALRLNAKFLRNGIVMLVLVAGTVALLYTWVSSSTPADTTGYSNFYDDVKAGNVSKVAAGRRNPAR